MSGTKKDLTWWFVRDSFNHVSSWVIELDGSTRQRLPAFERRLYDGRNDGIVYEPRLNVKLDEMLAEIDRYSHRIFMQFEYNPTGKGIKHDTVFANLDGETCEIGQIRLEG